MVVADPEKPEEPVANGKEASPVADVAAEAEVKDASPRGLSRSRSRWADLAGCLFVLLHRLPGGLARGLRPHWPALRLARALQSVPQLLAG